MLQDFIEEAQGQGRIGPRPKGDPLIGLGCRSAAVGIDTDDFGAAALRLQNKMKIDKTGLGAVAAPDDNHARMDRVGKFVPAGPKIGGRRDAEGIFQPFRDAIVDAARSGRGSADERREAVRSAFGEHSVRAAAGKKSKRPRTELRRDRA